MVADEVVVVLEARIADYQRKLAQADSSFKRATDNMANQAKRTTAIAGAAFSGFGTALLSTLSVGAIIALGGAFIQIADKAKLLNAQLKLATGEFGSFAVAQQDVRNISMQTRSSLESTTKLYSTFMRSANELGISQQQAARATLSVSQAFRISGADAVSAAQGTRQLVQAIQSGVLRGDEFNTMMESAPRLAKLLADSLGQPVKALRALAEAGKLTGDQLLLALTDRKFTDALDKEFARLPVTFDDAMTLVRNAAQITFSAFDRGGEFSRMLANFVTEGSSNFAGLEARAVTAGANLQATFSALDNLFDPMGDNAISVMRMIENEIRGMQNLIADLLGTLDSVSNFVPQWANNIRAGMRQQGLGGLVGPDTKLNDREGKFRMDIRQGRQKNLVRNITQGPLLSADMQQALGVDTEKGNYIPSPVKTKGGGRKKGGKNDAEAALEKAAREAEREQARQFAAEKELTQLTEDLASARAAQLTAAEAIYAFKLQEIENDRLGANADAEQAVITKNLTRAEADRVIILNDQIALERANLARLEESDRQLAASFDIREAQLQNDTDILESQAQFLKSRDMQKDAQLHLLDLQYELEALALEEVLASRDSTDAQKQIAQARKDILAGLKARDQRAIEKEYASPAAKYLDELETGFANVNDEIEQLAVDKVKELAGAFGEATANAFGLTGIIGNLISKLAEMAFQYAVILPLMRQVFGGQSGGGGGILGMLGGLFGGSPNPYGGDAILSSGIYGDIPQFAAGGSVRAGQRIIVGERGPELLDMPAAGRVVPNHALGPSGGESVVKFLVAPSPLFTPTMEKVAGRVSIEVVRAAAPAIVDTASAKTRIQMGRPRI